MTDIGPIPGPRRASRPGAWLTAGGWHVVVLAAIAYLGPLRSAPGRMPSDTKLYLYLNPSRLLADAPWMWDARQFGGWVPHQSIGYLWPMGPWFWIFERLGVPDWIAHRLWIGTLIFAAAAGMRWCARRLGLAAGPALAAALVYGLSPFIVPYVARTSGQLPNWAALPWLVGLVVGWTSRPALPHSAPEPSGVWRRRRHRLDEWRTPALIALVVASISGLNATAIIMITPAPLLWLIDAGLRRDVRWRRIGGFLTRTAVLCGGAAAWWLAGLVVQSRYGSNVLAFTETVDAVSFTSNGSEVLRGLGYWLTYVTDRTGPLTGAGTWYQVSSWSALTSFGLVAAAFAGLTLVHWRGRRFAAWSMLAGLVIGVGVHPITHASPLFSPIANSPASGFALALRSSTRAVPNLLVGLALGAGALAHGWNALVERRAGRRANSVGVGAVAWVVVGLLAIVNLPGLWRGELVSAAQSRDTDIPVAWQELGAALDQRPGGGRVLQLPGSEFGVHRWGTLVDPLLPAITERPLITRDLVPGGSAAAMDLLYALDDQLQEGTLDPRALAPVSRLLGADQVLVTGDLAFERFGSRRPALVDDFVGKALATAPLTFGEPVPNDPAVPYDDGHNDDAAAGNSLPAASLYDVPHPLGVARAKTDSVIVIGSGAGVVDAAGAGLIDGSELVRYAASMTDDQLATAGRDASLVVLTDSNRRAAHHWRGSQDVVGFTEEADGDAVLRTDLADHRLAVFPVERTDDQTVATNDGELRATATAYGESSTYRSEDRAANAVDGDITTAWLVGDRSEVVGEQLRVSRRDLSLSTFGRTVTLVQPQDAAATRWITGVRVTAGDQSADIALDESSRSPAGQTVDLPATSGPVTIEITTTNIGHQLAYPGYNAVGFAEVRVDDIAGTPEVIRLPTRVGPAPQHLAVVLSRSRIDPSDRHRNDPEPTLAREFTLPAVYTFDPNVTVRLDPRLADLQLREVVGVPGLPVASGHLVGHPAAGAWATVDGDPGTAWLTPADHTVGASITLPVPEATTVDVLELRLRDTQIYSRPTRVTVSMAGAGDPEERQVDVPAVDSDGITRLAFAPMTGSSVTLRIDEIEARLTSDAHTGEPLVRPAAVEELVVPGLPTVALPAEITTPCLELLTIDDRPMPTRLSGSTVDLLAGRPASVEWCADASLTLPTGTHRVATAPGSATGWTVDRVVLFNDSPGTPPSVATASEVTRSRTSRAIAVSPCPVGCWLVLGEGWNAGWHASITGRGPDEGGTDLGEPQVVDGGFNGWWLAPSTEPRTVTTEWTPQRTIWTGFAVSIVAVLIALVILVLTRRPSRPLLEPIEAPGALGTTWDETTSWADVAIAVVVAGLVIGPRWGLIAGLVALVARVVRRRLVISITGSVLVVGIAGWYIQHLRTVRPAPGYGWVRNIEAAHGWALLAVVLLAVATVSCGQLRSSAVSHGTAATGLPPTDQGTPETVPATGEEGGEEGGGRSPGVRLANPSG